MIEPKDVHCPGCFAKPGEPCTAPTDTGRRPTKSFHVSREGHATWLSITTDPLQDRQGDIWEKGEDGLLHSFETAPFSLEHVEKKWGPLTSPADEVLERYRRKVRVAEKAAAATADRETHETRYIVVQVREHHPNGRASDTGRIRRAIHDAIEHYGLDGGDLVLSSDPNHIQETAAGSKQQARADFGLVDVVYTRQMGRAVAEAKKQRESKR